MKLPTVLISTFVLAIAAVAVVQQSRVELRANLAAAMGRAKGHATWKTRDQGQRMQAELEVEGERLARNADFTVTVGKNAPIDVTTDGFGSFEIDQRFIGPTRPTVAAGNVVTVTDANNVVVLQGTLAPN